MPGIIAPPDIEVDVIAHLHDSAAITALTDNVGWRITKPYPCLRVVRAGGTTDAILRVDTALVQVEAWGDPDNSSSTQRAALARLLAVADAVLMGMHGKTTDTAVYGRVRVVNRGQWAPDETTHQQRYFSRLTIPAHAV